MKIIEVFGDGNRFPNGWHRYILTYVGTKWVRLLSPTKFHVIRIRKKVYDSMHKKEPQQDWTYYEDNLNSKLAFAVGSGKKVAAAEVNKVIDWMKDQP
tara:strand:- start:7666 stop:7959 length:294 start_codon:yes stop_codon:yes gene_type:complete